MTKFCYCESPIGRLFVAGDEGGLRRLDLGDAEAREPSPEGREDAAPFSELRRQLDEYFAGRRRHFTVRLGPRGTEFQRTVWGALRAIPFGQTETYGELAARIGRPRAVRAVGAANAANPIAILIPCHRVIGSDGSLTGYAGGIGRKETLLRLEGWEPRALRRREPASFNSSERRS